MEPAHCAPVSVAVGALRAAIHLRAANIRTSDNRGYDVNCEDVVYPECSNVIYRGR